MNGDRPKTREDRLAARLRDNLRRRKQQARALDDGHADETLADPLPKVPDAE
jgi:tRNA A37 threonylcarbamoyladenosine dehydratase